ncbi:uncharacterized protein LOC143025328 [Oratosquilla oratoria]|uniref:uncharacterized protein LOC143025328 n=1 Tax=Oratosquilla oratoria TaxID=337810 RepID=UPI003F76D15E
MRSAYPLLVENNTWNLGNTTRSQTALLRSVGVDLSQHHPSSGHLLSSTTNLPYRSSPHHHLGASSLHDIEVHLEDPPSVFRHVYPQPLVDDLTPRSSSQGLPLSAASSLSAVHRTSNLALGSNHRSTPHHLPHHRSPSTSDITQHLTNTIHRLERGAFDGGVLEGNSSRLEGRLEGLASPRLVSGGGPTRIDPTSPRSPRTSPRIVDHHQPAAAASLLAEALNLDPSSWEKNNGHHPLGQRSSGGSGNSAGGHSGTSGSNGVNGSGSRPALALTSMMRPSQLSLCCSTPEYYYNTERLRQEPEPGICACCDAKVSCCPCLPCCAACCPVGHMNSVCVSLLCCGIILFIVLSPLLHYLVPT